MLNKIIELGPDRTKENELRECLRAHTFTAERSRNHHNDGIIARAEDAVSSNQSLFSKDENGNSWLSLNSQRWSAGRFEAATVADLHQRAIQVRAAEAKAAAKAAAAAVAAAASSSSSSSSSPPPPPKASSSGTPKKPRLLMWVLGGASIATDIGTLQATAGADALFQVASQFNCLESPAAEQLTPVSQYVHDYTQGPRAAVGAFPATLLRHYSAPGPDGRPFTQETDGRQLDLLDEAVDPSLGGRRNGYFNGKRARNMEAIVEELRTNEDRIKVGVHADAEVVLGADWYGAVEGQPRITQVFTSTVAGGFYGGKQAFGRHYAFVSAALLRAAYRGTLLAAVAGRQRKAVLTLIGGGVFQNDLSTIWEAIVDAMEHIEPLLSGDMDVFVNVRELGALGRALPTGEPLRTVQRWGGAIVRFERNGNVVIDR